MINMRITASKNYAKLTQDTLSKAIKVGKRTLADYEKGVSEPKASTIIKIAEICKVNVTWLLTGKGEMLLSDEKTPQFTQKKDSNLSDEEQELLKKFRELPKELQEIHLDEIDRDLLNEEIKMKRKKHKNNTLQVSLEQDTASIA